MKSSHSENDRSGKSTVECDTNHQLEHVGNYMNILHDYTLFMMHDRCYHNTVMGDVESL